MQFKPGDIVSWWEIRTPIQSHRWPSFKMAKYRKDLFPTIKEMRQQKVYETTCLGKDAALSPFKSFKYLGTPVACSGIVERMAGEDDVMSSEAYMKANEDLRPALILSFTHGEEHYRVQQRYLTLVNRDAT